jgi:hypothetical protein
MEYFADLAVTSIKCYGTLQEDEKYFRDFGAEKDDNFDAIKLQNKAIRRFIQEKHEILVDSIYLKKELLPVWRKRYNNLFELKAKFLLMDEHTMKFYQ